MTKIMTTLLFIGTIMMCNCELIEFKKDNFVSLRETITQYSSSKLLSNLNKIETKHDTLYIYINSPGGDVMAGLEVINYIKGLQERNKEVICIAHHAMSMAFVIFQYCSQRYILYCSTLMQHQMSLSVNGKLYDINSRMSYLNTVETQLNLDQANRMNMTTRHFTYLIQNDWWLYSNDIITNNAADKVISISCLFENYEDTIVVNTIFGTVRIVYSACPTINYPLNIIFPSINLSEEEKNDFMKEHIHFMN